VLKTRQTETTTLTSITIGLLRYPQIDDLEDDDHDYGVVCVLWNEQGDGDNYSFDESVCYKRFGTVPSPLHS
jgi:hypothetical protein